VTETAAQLRFVLYARKSGPGDRSVGDQEKVGRRDIESIGGVVAAVFSDNLSASRYRRVLERPGFVATKDFIRAGHADALWTFANNRAHRTLDDYVELRALCVETSALWRYGKRTYDLTNSADRQATAADALRSEGQSDDISEAVQRGIDSALDEGRVHGKLLRGYRIIREEATGKPIRREPIPEQAVLIQEAAERILEGESLASVSRDFIAAWHEIGGAGSVDKRAVRAMLLRPTYAGLRTSGGQVRRPASNITPILTVETHEKLKALLGDPDRRTTTRGTTPVHLLSCIATCGKKGCGKEVSRKIPRERKHGRRHEYAPVYRCPSGHVSRNSAQVDTYVQELLLRLLERPETVRKLNAGDEKDQRSIEQDLGLIEQLQGEIEVFVKDAAKTRLSAQHVASYVAGVEDQITEARERVNARTALVDPMMRELAGPGVRERWEKRSLEEKRAVIRKCMQIRIMPVGRAGRYNDDLGVQVRPRGVLAGV
jgi:DNA invertase Pin-like site-specific DNA recombinase